MLPPQPRSTLFPYTTLFRSDRVLFPDRRARHFGPAAAQRIRLGVADLPNRDESVERRQGRKDRKSTRLNFSHVEISYAVFCLKKKKKKKKQGSQIQKASESQ